MYRHASSDFLLARKAFVVVSVSNERVRSNIRDVNTVLASEANSVDKLINRPERRVLQHRISLPLGLGLFHLPPELTFHLALGLRFGLSTGLVAGLGFGLTATPKHVNLRLGGRVAELWRGLAFGLGVCLSVGLVFALTFVLTYGLFEPQGWGSGLWEELASGLWQVGLIFGLAIGLVVGPAVGLIRFGSSPSIAQRASSTDSQRGDKRLTVLVTTTAGLAAGLPFVLLGLLSVLRWDRWLFGLTGVIGLAEWLVVGLVEGLAVVLAGRAWPAFLVASGWLAVCHRLPWRLIAFLDDAYRLGLLRVVGSAYQFRHAELQDHLAP